jgi:hypothetical protein
MRPTAPLPLPAPAGRRMVYRCLIPAAALILFGGLAELWHWGPHSIYFRVLNLFSFDPFRFPFLDIQVVLAAAECSRQGFDVYVFNPCDALDRPLAYSPLWLRITPHFLDTSATTAVGVGLTLLFIASLAAICRPATRRETLVLALTVLSPMVVYALERANADVVMFLLIFAGCALGRARCPWRFGAYALYFLAGVLKYYPLVLVVLVARERRRSALAIGAIAASVLLLLAARDRLDLVKALANIPLLPYLGDSFAAVNLPFGLAEIANAVPLHGFVGVVLLATLVGLAVARARRTLSLLNRAAFDWGPLEVQCLVVGADSGRLLFC